MPRPIFRRYSTCALGFLLLLSVSTLRAQEPQTTDHGFQDTARWARTFESPERARWQKPDQVVSALKLKPGQAVADIGAGTGYFTRRFARVVGPSGEALGLDIEPGMVDYMKADAGKLRLQNYQARLVKPDNPELAQRSVDLVFFCDVLHHIDDRVAYVRKLQPALKPGGRIAVIDFKKTAQFGPPNRMKIAREEMIAEFKQAGYSLVGEYQFLPYQYFLEFEPASRV